MGEANSKAVKTAKDFITKARVKYAIKKAILFGSQATGETREGSDIDLLIVSNNFKKTPVFMSKLIREWHEVQKKVEPVDFICLKEKQFEKLSHEITIVKKAVAEGVKIL
jgi:predicted nucleotidyltransferase